MSNKQATMRAFLIRAVANPHTVSIEETVLPKGSDGRTLEAIYALLGVDCVSYYSCTGPFAGCGFYCDDEGLMKPHDAYLYFPPFYDGVLATPLLLVGETADGDIRDCRFVLSELREMFSLARSVTSRFAEGALRLQEAKVAAAVPGAIIMPGSAFIRSARERQDDDAKDE